MKPGATQKLISWARFIDSRYAKTWNRLTDSTQIALKRAYWAGWAAAQFEYRNKK